MAEFRARDIARSIEAELATGKMTGATEKIGRQLIEILRGGKLNELLAAFPELLKAVPP